MEKQVINGDDSLNLIPIKYQYAYQFYQNGKKNFWIPSTIGVGDDMLTFKTKLTEVEKHVFTHVFAQLSTLDIAATDIVSKLGQTLTSPEHKMAIATQAYQEAIHAESYAYVAEHIGMDEEWLWSRWKDVPAIKAKIDFATEIFNSGEYPFVYQYFFLAAIFESAWFMCGFNPILALNKSNKMSQTSQMLFYIARDEQLHINFGINTINSIVKETNLDKASLVKGFSKLANKAYQLEKDYIEFIFSEGNYLGYSIKEHLAHLTFRIRQSFHKLGLTLNHLELYEVSEEPKWLHEMLLSQKVVDFFGVHNGEYQTTKLTWDDEVTELPSTNKPTKLPDYSCDDHSCCQ